MTTPDDPDVTAGELALGVLEGEERAAALRRVLSDPAFAREVDRWRAYLAGFTAGSANVEPGAAADRIVATIPGLGSASAARWRWAAAISSAVAAMLLLVLLFRPAPPPVISPSIGRAAPSLVAAVRPEQGDPFGAVFDTVTRELRLGGTVPVPSGRDAELWAIGPDGVPKAIGLLKNGRLVVPSALTIEAGTTLAVSVEPLGGSPKSTPTGPVVATGKLSST